MPQTKIHAVLTGVIVMLLCVVAIDVIVQHIKQHFANKDPGGDKTSLRKASHASSDGGRRVSSDFRASLV